MSDEFNEHYAVSDKHAPGPRIHDMRRCGVGRGAHCCIYITAGTAGICCERHTHFAALIRSRKHTFTAQWEPTAPFPLCQDENIRTRQQ